MRHVYRHQNSYHNFEHALDVLQAIHMFLCSAGRVPPASILLESDGRSWRPKQTAGKPALVNCLTPSDLFCLYVASIGHDVGHPGVTNNFMVSCSSSSAVCRSHHSIERRKTLKLHCHRFMTIILPWSNFTTPSFCTSSDVKDSAFCLTILMRLPIFENYSQRPSWLPICVSIHSLWGAFNEWLTAQRQTIGRGGSWSAKLSSRLRI